MDEAKIKEVFSDEEFVKSLFVLETPQEVQEALSEKGLKLSVAEIEMIRERLIGGEGELSEDELDSVAGGGCIIDFFVSSFNSVKKWVDTTLADILDPCRW